MIRIYDLRFLRAKLVVIAWIGHTHTHKLDPKQRKVVDNISLLWLFGYSRWYFSSVYAVCLPDNTVYTYATYAIRVCIVTEKR